MAACESISIISKVKDQYPYKLTIEKRKFDADHQRDVVFPEPTITSFEGESGTIIYLEHFTKEAWKEINSNEIKTEIEKHFEMILRRSNISINIVHSGNVSECKCFKYDDNYDDCYRDTINKVSYEAGRRYKKKKIINLTTAPIEIELFLTKGKALQKPPIFVVKGRRIAEVKDVKSFKSGHKSDLWSHPNLTGFIDLKGWVEPTIARTDFRLTDKVKAIFSSIYELEPMILEEIKKINRDKDNKHYSKLENYLNNILKKLAKKDDLKHKKDENIPKRSSRFGSVGSMISDYGGKDHGNDQTNKGANNSIGLSEGDGKGYGDDKGPLPGRKEGGQLEFLDDSLQKKNSSGNRKYGFNIRIVDRPPDKTKDGKEVRSEYLAGEIIIYRKHKDFETRVKKTKKGESRITDKLISYLVSEIAIHYKDKLYSKIGIPAYNQDLFVEFTNFVYEFEEQLYGLSGKNLNKLTE